MLSARVLSSYCAIAVYFDVCEEFLGLNSAVRKVHPLTPEILDRDFAVLYPHNSHQFRTPWCMCISVEVEGLEASFYIDRED